MDQAFRLDGCLLHRSDFYWFSRCHKGEGANTYEGILTTNFNCNVKGLLLSSGKSKAQSLLGLLEIEKPKKKKTLPC